MSPSRPMRVRRLLLALAAVSALTATRPAQVQAAAVEAAPAAGIVAVVNGDVVSIGDVENRTRLFALSTGLPARADVLSRLAVQIARQLIDERLRLQEMQRRRVAVLDQEIARAVGDLEQRNGMPGGTLRTRLGRDGVSFRTLVDQLRVQIGWSRVIRQVLGPLAQVSETDVAERERQLKSQIGQTEYRVSEIFIPAETPAQTAEAGKFAEAVIQQLRAGAPFPVVAAQFSQSQTALQGGDLGWVQASQLDPSQVAVLGKMPPGAVSNPLRVPGGFSIVSLRGKREIGRETAMVLHVRQAFFPFTSRLDPAKPTEQQKQMLEQSQKLSSSARACGDVEAANKGNEKGHPANPGDVRLESTAPALRAVLEKLPDNKASAPLVAEDGIMIVMVCDRAKATEVLPSKQELADTILNERIELASRQLIGDLRRRGIIDERS